MKVFISHKQEDSITARLIENELKKLNINYYLDLLDDTITENGKTLTDHIRANLEGCTDMIVIMSQNTRYSQWVPFEVGLATERDMPTATFLKEDVLLPEFLQYWPRLKKCTDIIKYVSVRKQVDAEYRSYSSGSQMQKIDHFYNSLKEKLSKRD